MCTVMILGTYEQAELTFRDRAQAQEWAQRYAQAFPSHKIWVVEGEVTRIAATKPATAF